MRFRFSDCVLDAERFELSRGGRTVAVQPKVLELLLFLMRNHERAVTKQELLDAVWPDTATGETSLTRAVSFARTAVGEREKDARVIRTVRGRGYKIGVPVVVERPEAAPASREDSGFVCRERELAVACAALDEAVAGRGQLLLLVGEPGVGKTRLALELAERARGRGAQPLWGRCQEGEDGRAYWPWEQLLRAGLPAWDLDLVERALGDRGAEVAELVPELRWRLTELPRPAADPERARARLFDAVNALLASCASATPLVLVLDDLHCADGPSLRLLRFLAPQLPALRILLLGTYRDLALSARHPLVDTLAELSRFHPPERKLLLRGLERGCVRRFIAHQLGSEPSSALVTACHARSEGNPLFLLELLHWLRSRDTPLDEAPEGWEHEIPEGIRHVIRRRLAALSEPCRRALGCASVLGREFAAELVARAGDVAEPELLARLEEAEAARVVEPSRASPGQFRFAHPLIGETLYAELGSATRARLHARVGEALEERYRPRPLAKSDLAVPIRGAHLAELARHFYAALPLVEAEKALDYCERAAAHAASVLAFAEAERLYERALRVLESSAPADAERRERLSARRDDARARAG
jgi:predicted ATPase